MKFLIAAAASLALTASAMAAAYPTETSGAATASGARPYRAQPIEVAAGKQKPETGGSTRPARNKSNAYQR